MRTHNQGWTKKHKVCGGLVQYIESLDTTHNEWDLFCLRCAEYLCEEDIEFERGH